ncbi:hypothetical protein EVAR_103785_1 [Eumeta japonica]|uniref:PiggyBac transposable element-derived protein 4 n=1 Tax=Eumeta variegata TaxID=151549 RepID=A0A4C1Z0E7_EUMVA|nr:hypothetical protein EVAR_103785_1 [Eumeta japonica]
MANRMQDDDIAAALLEENVSEDDENYPYDSDHNSDHISEASESDSDTDMEDPEPVEETPPTLPFYTGKDYKTKWYKTPPRTNTMFNNRIERKKSNIRRNFIKQLGLSLLEDHLRKRKDNPHVPRDIRKRIHQILDEEVPGPPQKQPKKSQRCSFCPRNKDRKTLNGCFKCNVAICKEHAN